MSFDNNADWTSARAEQPIADHSCAKSLFDGGELLASPLNEMAASMRRRSSLLKSIDLLNKLVLDDFDLFE